MSLDNLSQQYENGSLSRRELLGALALLVAAPAAAMRRKRQHQSAP